MHRCLAQTVLFLSGKLKYNILEVMNMRKMLKENKGFSLVELLVAILIMAVIAGTAITLFGGVLNSSRENADKETAESIKRAILTYMNSTNDVNLSCLGQKWTVAGAQDGKLTSDNLIQYLGLQISIPKDTSLKPSFKKPGSVPASVTVNAPPTADVIRNASDLGGDFGPFLDLTKDFSPKKPGTTGWIINIDKEMQVVDVEPSVDPALANCVVSFITGTSV